MELSYSATNQLEHAIYLPALQASYSQFVCKTPKPHWNFPGNTSLDDFNFFNRQSKLFNLNAVLYSAGGIRNHVNPPKCMVTERDRNGTFVVGDSGGYQIATGNIQITKKKREEIYQWLVEHCNLAMTLDVPTGPMYGGAYDYYRSFEDCLTTTLGHLEAFRSMGAEEERMFLNVLQGQGTYDCDIWYDEVKAFNFYGWAIAGGRDNPLQVQLWRILKLIEDGKFNRDATWIHFLGVGDLKTAVLLTTLRDALRHRFPSCRIEISYDTSTPFLLMSTLSAVSSINLSRKSTSLAIEQIDKADWADSDELLPFQGSEMSKIATKGDVIYRQTDGTYRVRDLGYMILQNHNIEATVGAIDAIHALLGSGIPRKHMEQLLPYRLLEARDTIEDVILEKHSKTAFSKLMSNPTKRILANAYVR